MDELIKTMILGAPNLSVAIFALYWSAQRIDKMIEAQTKLIDALLLMCAENHDIKATQSGAPQNDVLK